MTDPATWAASDRDTTEKLRDAVCEALRVDAALVLVGGWRYGDKITITAELDAGLSGWVVTVHNGAAKKGAGGT